MKKLIIEDEYNLADAIASTLKSKKYSVEIKRRIRWSTKRYPWFKESKIKKIWFNPNLF